MTTSSELPSLGDLLLPLLERVATEHRPLFIAVAERTAASRYRGWANAVGATDLKASLLECAAREEKIASLIESLYPDADAIERALSAKIPELIDTTFFAQFSLKDQFAIQAQGERLGAATWRSFAKNAQPDARDVFLECAILEEESGAFLESIARQIL